MHIAGWMLATSLFFGTIPAMAQDELDDASRATVRRLADEGGKLYQDGQYAAALEKLQRAYAIYPVPSIGYYSARCLEALGRWVEASERYVEVTRLDIPATAAEVHRKAQANAIEARDKLLPRIPRLQVNVKGAAPEDVSIKIDDVTLKPAQVGLARPADPGEHVIVADRWGDVLERRAILEEGGLRTVDLVFEVREPPPPPATKEEVTAIRITSYVLMGVGGAGMITGAITGSILLVEDNRLSDECSVDRCSARSDVGLANAMRLPTTISLAAGGGLFATGLLMYYLAPASAKVEASPEEPGTEEVSVMPLLGPGFVGLSGTF